jgi:amino acid permease
MHYFIANLGVKNPPDVCLVILAVGIVLFPFLYFKSPEDFWWLIVGGMACTFMAIVLIIAGESIDCQSFEKDKLEKKPFKIMNLFSALGTFLFTYAGHSAFPSIQHDMR